jgi:hypothetical protein
LEGNQGDVKAVAGHAAGNVTRKHYIAKNLERIAHGKLPLAPKAKRTRKKAAA